MTTPMLTMAFRPPSPILVSVPSVTSTLAMSETPIAIAYAATTRIADQ